MEYSRLVEIYNALSRTNSRLQKIEIISELIRKQDTEEINKIIYLLQGKIFPHYEEKNIGMSSRLILKVISSSTGTSLKDVEKKWKNLGDLGEVAETLIKNKKQQTLATRKLTVEKVYDNISKLADLEGQGTVNKKISLISELLTSAKPEEAKYIVRTVLETLRVGVADGVIRDAIAKAFNQDVKKVERAFDILSDYGEVIKKSKQNKLDNLKLQIGRPIKAMLAIKVQNIDEAFKATGKLAQCEFKLDGFRVQIHKNNKEVKLFTRSMEDVTNQFKEMLPLIIKNVNCKSCILDSEFVGYDPKTKKYLPFQKISQRIKRKYDIEKIAKEYPVEANVFDILNYNNEDTLNKTQKERREILEKVVKEEKNKLILTKKLITSNYREANKFFKEALKSGTEGLIIKNLNAKYQPGRRVHGWVKLKTTLEPLDLVIVGAEWGAGKRVGTLSSFVLACKNNDQFLECGMLGTGIKEKSEKGVSFKELTKILKPLIIEEKGRTVKIKPKVVVQVLYEEIQKSPTYKSGYALRFPRLQLLRTGDKKLEDINTIKDIIYLYKKQKK